MKSDCISGGKQFQTSISHVIQMEIFFLKFMAVEFEIIIIDGAKFSPDRSSQCGRETPSTVDAPAQAAKWILGAFAGNARTKTTTPAATAAERNKQNPNCSETTNTMPEHRQHIVYIIIESMNSIPN